MAKICNKQFVANCDTCFEMVLGKPCNGFLFIDVNLTPTSVYYFWVIDKFKNVYREPITVLGDGSFGLNLAEYPSGFFNEYAGTFMAFLTTDLAGANKITFTITDSYTCMIFNIY